MSNLIFPHRLLRHFHPKGRAMVGAVGFDADGAVEGFNHLFADVEAETGSAGVEAEWVAKYLEKGA